MQPDDRARVTHMIDAAQQIEEFAQGRQSEDLNTDTMLLFALVRALEVLGEAANGVTPETMSKASDVPWSLIIATRNRLIHGYFDVDPDIVWKTVSEEIPPLLPKLRFLLKELG